MEYLTNDTALTNMANAIRAKTGSSSLITYDETLGFKTAIDAIPTGGSTPVHDGKMRVYIHLEEGRLSPYLGLAVKGSVDIDWGDNTTHSTLTGSDASIVVSTQHTYASGGDYVIVLTVTGSASVNGSGNYGLQLLWKNSPSNDENKVYQNAIQKVEIGNNILIGSYAFYACFSLSSVTIPSGVTSIGNYAFYSCYSLSSVTIQSGVTSISDNMFRNCYSLASITIPDGVTSIGAHAFNNCYGLGFIKFEPTTPPTVANSNAWSNIPTDCIIYVPTGALEAYTTATNYPDPTAYTYEEY